MNLVAHVMQIEQEPLLPIPVATEKRPDPRLALTIGVAGWIADPKDFGKASQCVCIQDTACDFDVSLQKLSTRPPTLSGCLLQLQQSQWFRNGVESAGGHCGQSCCCSSYLLF